MWKLLKYIHSYPNCPFPNFLSINTHFSSMTHFLFSSFFSSSLTLFLLTLFLHDSLPIVLILLFLFFSSMTLFQLPLFLHDPLQNSSFPQHVLVKMNIRLGKVVSKSMQKEPFSILILTILFSMHGSGLRSRGTMSLFSTIHSPTNHNQRPPTPNFQP